MPSPQRTLQEIKDNKGDYLWCRECCCFNVANAERCYNCDSPDLTSNLDEHIEDEEEYQAYCNGVSPIDAFYTVM
jgi:hypothetical protein